MKLIGFAQLHNELQKGNLINWFKCMEICDYIYIFDQNSTDGSKEIYKKHDNVRVIYSPINDFANEIKCKSLLLKLLLNDHPDVDWIFWLDGDTLLERKLLHRNKLNKFFEYCNSENIDGVYLGHLNLWRSDLYYRVDNYYDWLNNEGVLAFWKNNGHLSFPDTGGLHEVQWPSSLKSGKRLPYNLIHKGFSTDNQILARYKVYKERGAEGYHVERLIDETGLEVKKMDKDMLPEWYTDINDVNPTTLKKLTSSGNQPHIPGSSTVKKEIEIIALIYKSVDYLDFIVDQLTSDFCNVPGWDVGVRIIANDATKPVLSALENKNIPFTIYNDPAPQDFYLNRIYKCWNFGGKSSKYANICFVNSDMAFSEGWLANLLKYHNGVNIPCARLVESNKMPSGKYGINENFGRNPKTINLDAWYNYASSVKEESTSPGGLYMPCVFETNRFIESNMYPHGNVFKTNEGLEVGRPNDRQLYKSGDDYYFSNILERKYNMKHITVFDSLVYHIQEGEKDE